MKTALHCFLSPVETLHYYPHFLLTELGKDPSDCFLSVHIFWACFPVGRSPLAPADTARADSSLSFTYFPAALLHCATASLHIEAPGQTGSAHTELDGLSLSREESETAHRVTGLSISISLPPGKQTKVSDLYRLLSENTAFASFRCS